MVRNDEFRETGETTKHLAGYIDMLRKVRGISQLQMAKVIRDTTHPSYISVRLSGKKAWNLDDLDSIAPLLGYESAMGLIEAAGRWKERTDASSPSTRAVNPPPPPTASQ